MLCQKIDRDCLSLLAELRPCTGCNAIPRWNAKYGSRAPGPFCPSVFDRSIPRLPVGLPSRRGSEMYRWCVWSDPRTHRANGTSHRKTAECLARCRSSNCRYVRCAVLQTTVFPSHATAAPRDCGPCECQLRAARARWQDPGGHICPSEWNRVRLLLMRLSHSPPRLCRW